MEIGCDELAQIETRRADRHDQLAHSTLPGFKMPFGSSARFSGVHDREFHRIGAAREFRRLQPPDAVLGADAAAEAFDQIEHRELEHRASRDEALDVGVRAFGSH